MSDRKVVTVVYTWTSPAEDAERDLEAVLSGGMSPFDHAGLTVDSWIEDMTNQEMADRIIYLYGEDGEPGPDHPDAA